MGDTVRALDREIASLAVPAALALATDPLYELCDTAILGHVGSAQLAGAALALRILDFGYAAFVFLMFGTTAVVARREGAGDHRGAAEQATTAVWLAAALGLVAAAVFSLAGPFLIHALGGRGDVARHAGTYLTVSLAGMPAFTIVLAGVGFCRGLHDTRTPFLVAAGSVAVNLALEVALVFGFGYGVGASAFGTVVAKWLSAAVYLVIVSRSVRRHGATWRPRRTTVTGQLVVGRDLVLRTAVLLGVFTAAQSWALRIGGSAPAAHAIAFQVWLFSAYAIDGLEAAGQTMVANRLGADRPGETTAVARRLVVWAARAGAVFAVLVLATSWVSPRIFTADDAVASLATGTMWWVAALQPVNAVAFALDGILVGAGEQRYLAGAMAFAGAVFALAGGLAAGTGAALGGVWLAVSAFMVVRCGAGLWRLRVLRRPTVPAL